MKKKLPLLSLVATCLFGHFGFAQENTRTTTIFDKIVFYDGYAATSEEAVPPGVVRLNNALYAKKMTNEERQAILSTMEVEVTIGALCDNYDRIGGVFLSLVPQGQPMTDQNKKTIEIGRFITPFMNKNRQPTEVPYVFDLQHLVPMFKDQSFAAYDFWIEFNVFGVPYAANNEVSGCAGRSDVFEGTLKIKSQDTGNAYDTFFLLPLASRDSFNNYNATDVAGTTTKIYQFTLDDAIRESYFHLITSNHGANQGGEEYVRRTHQVYLDGDLIETYKPGGKSCEPYRQYNTQGNGIYGSRPRTEADWTSWNNWCPGDVIPNRIFKIANLQKGTHEFKVTVPDARFVDGQGDFPLSLFFFAKGINGVLATEKFEKVSYQIYPNPTSDVVAIHSPEEVKVVTVYDMSGSKVLETNNTATIDCKALPSGTYLFSIAFANGIKTTEKIVKK
ncbi:peptide-N-glycosidase F-related protein [Myroides odoratus]|uniref:peptide-N-glycosidase F-related protein n=1 Tax=Myroides odoratus TaxID=256 RepID=UPI000766070B|nr:peptide-N-glycosidase F-related protein [Myroides odoratus]